MPIEAAGDPIWNERARGLLRFLEKPRTWAELEAWARKALRGEDLLRHTIAHADELIVREGDRWRSIYAKRHMEES